MTKIRKCVQWAAVVALLVSVGMLSDVRPATAQHGGGGGHGGGFGGHGGGHGGFGGHGGHLGHGGFGFGPYGLGYGYLYYGGYAYYGGDDCYLVRRRVVGPHGRVYFRRIEVCH